MFFNRRPVDIVTFPSFDFDKLPRCNSAISDLRSGGGDSEEREDLPRRSAEISWRTKLSPTLQLVYSELEFNEREEKIFINCQH